MTTDNLGQVGYYGKLAGQADYFRQNAGEFARLGFDRWFQESLETIHSAQGQIPDEPVQFVLAGDAGSPVFIGAFVPSRDAVGRRFPLIGFQVLARSLGALDLPLLPGAAAPFLGQLVEALNSGRTLTAEAFGLQAARVMPCDLSGSALVADGSQETLAPLGFALGGLPHGAAYALRTLQTACEQVRRAPAKTAITLEAPAPTPATRAMWLTLVLRHLGSSPAVLPRFFWTEQSGRLLITLGAPSPAVLGYLSRDSKDSNRYWPLRTDSAPALQAAYDSLSPVQRGCLDSPSSTLANVVLAFG